MKRFTIAAAVLFVCALSVTVFLWARLASVRETAVAESMPPGWMALVRQRTIAPAEVLALALPRSIARNGAEALWEPSRGVWRHLRLDSSLARAMAGRPSAGDLLARSEIEHDAVLDRWVAAARSERWSNLAAIMAHSGEEGARNIFALQPPRYQHTLQAMEFLALRGWLRSGAGDTAGARTDFGAVTAIGFNLVRHEPTLDGFLTGRAVVHYGALGFKHLATVTRDTALARRAEVAAGWSSPSTATSYSILMAAPDSSLAMARDTAISLGWRAASLAGWIAAPMNRPGGVFFGLPGSMHRELESLAASGDAEWREVASLALETARTIDASWPLGRWSRYRGSRLARRLVPSVELPRVAADTAASPR